MIISERSQEIREGYLREPGAERPVFELVSFAIPPRWRSNYNETDRMASERASAQAL